MSAIPLHEQANAASARVEAAFPDRYALCVAVQQQSDGRWCVYAGKASRMRRIVRSQPTIGAAEAAAIARIAAE